MARILTGTLDYVQTECVNPFPVSVVLNLYELDHVTLVDTMTANYNGSLTPVTPPVSLNGKIVWNGVLLVDQNVIYTIDTEGKRRIVEAIVTDECGLGGTQYISETRSEIYDIGICDSETIVDGDLATAGTPTDADVNAYVAASGPFNGGTLIKYAGGGTADDPDYVWEVAPDGSITNIESPNCCPDPTVTLVDGDLVTAGTPTSADVTTYIGANGPYVAGTLITYIGAGTADDPDYVWMVEIDGTATNLESPFTVATPDPTVTLVDGDLVTAGSPTSADVTTYVAANGPYTEGTKIIYIGAGTADDPDYVWVVEEDLTNLNIESPAETPAPTVTLVDGDLVTAGNPTDADVTTYVTANGPYGAGTLITYIGEGTADNPDYVWIVEEDGTTTNIESPPVQMFALTCDQGNNIPDPLPAVPPTIPAPLYIGMTQRVEYFNGYAYWTWNGLTWDLCARDFTNGPIITP